MAKLPTTLGTDIVLIERTCSGGCGRKFKCLATSKQKTSFQDCDQRCKKLPETPESKARARRDWGTAPLPREYKSHPNASPIYLTTPDWTTPKKAKKIPKVKAPPPPPAAPLKLEYLVDPSKIEVARRAEAALAWSTADIEPEDDHLST